MERHASSKGGGKRPVEDRRIDPFLCDIVFFFKPVFVFKIVFLLNIIFPFKIVFLFETAFVFRTRLVSLSLLATSGT